ncbi:MAG: gamma-glutamyltransferase [Burkholderiales bacterium]|nr:gamma-glutamyltransferase [Burkholderiales bacterium]
MSAFDWQFPYTSRRKPILARNIVATSQPLAAQAGLRMLQRGGSAMDAALATAIALTVLEPVSNGIGSDAFAIVWDGEKLHGFNASGRSPAAWTPEFFKDHKTMPVRGWNTVTVPGCVSAWSTLSGRFGKLPFADLFEPAIAYARDGYMVSPTIAGQWAKQTQELQVQPGFKEAFMPKGRAPLPGEKFSFPDQAKTLELIAESHGEAFYRGDIVRKIAAHAKEHGALMIAADFAAHLSDWVEPLAQDYRGYTLQELPPNGQGIAALMALGILQHFDVASYPVDSADSVHLQIEAMKIAFADIYRYVSDPRTMEVRNAELLDPAYLKGRAKLIDMKRAQDFKHGTPPKGGTVYLTAADASGMMVSFIQSNYMGFGSGVVVPGTGVSLQNRGHTFSLQPGHPNQVGPAKRPFQTIIPGFVTKDGKPVMSFGVMGGSMQPQGHAQVMVRLADYGQNPQACADGPRYRVVEGLRVNVEPGFSRETLAELERRGHQLEELAQGYLDFGSAQMIYKLENGYLGASDPRRDGQAVGF